MQLALKRPWMTVLLVSAAAITGASIYYGLAQFSTSRVPSASSEVSPSMPRIVALGRVEPVTEVIQVTAPVELQNDRVAQVLVQRGDRVEAGQVLAILNSHTRLQEARLEAQEAVRVAQAELAQVQAGAKSGEIVAQQAEIARLQADLQGERSTQAATIARWQAEVNTARAEYDRHQSLYQEGAISASELDSKRLAWETSQAQLQEAIASQNRTMNSLQQQIQQAQATLDQVAEVRPVDVQLAQAKVEQAIATAQRVETELEQAYIRAPIAGRVLELHVQPGEAIGEDGIADLGQTEQMQVIAEVYQTDIGKIRAGQAATVTSESLTGALQGTVEQIGLQVNRQRVFSNEPGENLDRRVVDVRIRLDSDASQQVANLTNLQVQVAIQP
jgi:HlyD family secretion protein